MKRSYTTEWESDGITYRLTMSPPEIERLEATIPVTCTAELAWGPSLPITQTVTVELTKENTDPELWEALRRKGNEGIN